MVIKEVVGLRVEFGGEEHSGWLPRGAALPRPMPIEAEVVDVRISHCSDGYLLEWFARPSRTNPEPLPPKTGDLWYRELEDAEAAAREMFGISQADWTEVG